MAKFTEDIELDAALVRGWLKGGPDGFLMTALRIGVKNPAEAAARAKWAKRRIGYWKKVVAVALVPSPR